MKTTHPHLTDLKKAEKWLIIDADNKILGKIATRAAIILRGKDKPIFHPSVICGDNLIIINAEKVAVTGKKETDKEYVHYTGYPGGLRTKTLGKMRAEHPERILETAIKGMIPRNRLRKLILERLYVYAGTEHPHGPQNPQSITID
ncbi:MAG: 50S ribosomal protein L13 [Candidatus Gracilibacteria bacterium]